MLAVVRYTAYGEDENLLLFAKTFTKTPQKSFAALKRMETALVAGIDVSVMSHYEANIFPVISDYLTL